MPTSKDVARLAGVSHTTVSRAFRGDVRLRPETYKKVMEAAESLGYSPNQLASGLKQRRSKTIGLIISDIANPFFMIIAERLERILDSEGYRLLISFDQSDAVRQERAMSNMIGAAAEAVLFSPAKSETVPAFIKSKSVRLIQMFSKEYDDIPYFRFDDDHGAYTAAQYLTSKGHRNIMFLGGADRISGYERALTEIAAAPQFYEDNSSSREELSAGIADYIITRRPTAVCAVGEHYALAAMEAFRALHLSFPKDISFIIYDDLNWAKMMDVTVISHPIEDLAKLVAKRIFELINGNSKAGVETFLPFLIERSSVREV